MYVIHSVVMFLSNAVLLFLYLCSLGAAMAILRYFWMKDRPRHRQVFVSDTQQQADASLAVKRAMETLRRTIGDVER